MKHSPKIEAFINQTPPLLISIGTTVISIIIFALLIVIGYLYLSETT